MEELLYRARSMRCEWAVLYDPDAARRAPRARSRRATSPKRARSSRALDQERGRAKAVAASASISCTASCTPLRRDTASRPGCSPRSTRLGEGQGQVFEFILDPDRLGGARDKPGVAPLLAHIEALADAAVPLATAVAQRFGPLVEERLRARKRAAGLFDFDDMLLLVDEALRGPRGAELAATLRARYRLAVIDEFQDTDPVQWQIFRTIFLEGGDPRPLYLVGDPKQSIYGFRGADVSTYDGARDAVTALGGVHHLERNFRSTPAVIDTYNAIFDQTGEAARSSRRGSATTTRSPTAARRASRSNGCGR